MTDIDNIAASVYAESAESRGYARAVAVLRDVATRTGSPAARWAADYLTANARVGSDRSQTREWPPGGTVTDRWLTCAGCGDDIGPGEHVYPGMAAGAVRLRCAVCEVKAPRLADVERERGEG